MAGDRTPGTVLMTTDTVGGVWIYALELARSLSDRGIRVVLAASGGEPTPTQREAAASIRGLVLESRPYKLEWMQDAWDDVGRAAEWLLDLESTYRPDIIHLNSYSHGALSWSAPVLVVGHSCVWSWFFAVRGGPPPAGWDGYRARVARGLKAADAVTSPTRAMLAELRRHYGTFRSVGAVYNARRIPAAMLLSTASILLRATSIDIPHKDFVLTVGRLWDEAKNVNMLDAAARAIEWPVIAAGAVKNPDGGEIRFSDIRLLGSLAPEEVGWWMGRASIYALPARYEPFGLTALEAANAGCALVLGDIPSLREVWQDAAVFVPPDNSEALAEAVNALIRDQSHLERMAARARLHAAGFTVDRMARAYIDIYSNLLSNAEARRRDRRPRLVSPEPLRKTAETTSP